MRHEAAVLPDVQLIAGRLEIEAEPRAGSQIDPDLVRRARRRAGDGAGKAPVDRPVKVPAQNALDLLVPRDDLGKGGRVAETVAIHEGDAGGEGRMVHHDDGG